MMAYVFSVGEPTTDISIWSLERLGLSVKLIENSETSLWEKLDWLYHNVDEDFIRVDADCIVNKNVLKLEPRDNCWWHQSWCWGWHKQDLVPSSVGYVRKEALMALRQNIEQFKDAERPESQMFRLDEFHHPRRCEVYNIVTGLHGYGQDQANISRVKRAKARRQQDYDWELSERIGHL